MPLRPLPLRLRPLSAGLLAALLSGCGTSPAPQYHRLRLEPPPEARTLAPAAEAPVWQLLPVQLPPYLERETLWQPQPQGGLQPLGAHRWAEPLRDAVARVLLADLARLRGPASVFGSPLPNGLTAQRQLRVEWLRLDAEPDGTEVVLQARWWLQDPRGQAAPEVREVRLSRPAPGGQAEALVAAHRELLWQLAQQISASARRP
jgi:uncharacterized lipoprotein YmbA